MRYENARKILLVVILAVGLAACSDEGSSSQATWYERNTLYSYSGDHGNLWDRMRGDMRMPTYTNTRQVREQIRYFQNHQDYLNHIIAESAPYIYYIYQETQKRHLPAELALIPVIESEYNPYAKSKVGALGLWQMMPTTARGFGLKRDWWYDGRKDVVASTNAALEYFSYLHGYFNNNWLLAVGAYDCGEGTIMACERYNQNHHRSGDFWNLPLPYETQAYVPKLLAVAAIVKHPSYYGIHLAPINDQPYIEQVNVGSPMALSKAASMAEVPLTTMKVLNPGIQHGTTDPKGPYVLLVPEDKANTFKEKLGILTENEKIAWQKHIVESKETLEKIALKYRTTVALLRQVNGLKSDKVHPHQALLIPPVTTTNSTGTANNAVNPTPIPTANQTSNVNVATTNDQTSQDNDTRQSTYTVKSGDHLWKIANKYHVTTKELLTWNKMSRHHRLHAGETLIITAPDTTATTTTTETTTTAASPQPSKNLAMKNATESNSDNLQPITVTYEVKNEDDLNKIAHQFHITVAQLKKANNLSSNTVQVGQELAIPTSDNMQSSNEENKNTTTSTDSQKENSIYTVRRGDYLAKIAKRFGISEEDIKKWNKLSERSSDDLQPGQKLIVHADT